MKIDPSLQRLKILIVDDEPANIILLEYMLRDKGFSRVQSLSDSRQVIATCAQFAPDLILLDLMMPHINGITILETLRAEEEKETFLPVLVLTADVTLETKRRALDAGATDFLLKPFDQIEVLLRIRNLLENRRMHTLLGYQRAALEEAVRDRTAELRETILRLQKAEAPVLVNS